MVCTEKKKKSETCPELHLRAVLKSSLRKRQAAPPVFTHTGAHQCAVRGGEEIHADWELSCPFRENRHLARVSYHRRTTRRWLNCRNLIFSQYSQCIWIKFLRHLEGLSVWGKWGQQSVAVDDDVPQWTQVGCKFVRLTARVPTPNFKYFISYKVSQRDTACDGVRGCC